MRESGTTGIIFAVTGMVVKNGGFLSFEVEVRWQQVAVSGHVRCGGCVGLTVDMGWPYMSHNGDEVGSADGSEGSG
ncbi:hypothetical protein L1987_60227 [Smallanthus sonchifolius]|uniref:Uncharacterized protein n=1 Tax=Smallanthus sonchifolius TaxID=185202 RepID=A0ACB9D8B4_9ASTR|nr:hypothetical protein L1987_60227 [Smallanthus sonchifolius]